MNSAFFSPPVAFVMILALCFFGSFLFSKLSFHSKSRTAGGGKPYECGHEQYDHMAQPDYSIFFPFAFFFTIAHVATLIMTTLPLETLKIFLLIFLYMAGALTGLYILLRK
jgi:NADH:ubiquinone oxidoreductase subunit 3 (subunit A)